MTNTVHYGTKSSLTSVVSSVFLPCLIQAAAIVCSDSVTHMLHAGGDKTASEIMGALTNGQMYAAGASLAAALGVSGAWALSTAAAKQAAYEMGERELVKMSASEPLAVYASSLPDGAWLVRDSGTDTQTRILELREYVQWRKKVDAGNIPLVVMDVENITVTDDDGYSTTSDNVLVARKLLGGKPHGFSHDDPFMVVYNRTAYAENLVGRYHAAEKPEILRNITPVGTGILLKSGFAKPHPMEAAGEFIHRITSLDFLNKFRKNSAHAVFGKGVIRSENDHSASVTQTAGYGA